MLSRISKRARSPRSTRRSKMGSPSERERSRNFHGGIGWLPNGYHREASLRETRIQVRRKALIYIGFVQSWERTGLVARTVFKIAEAVARRLVGSIPTRSRQTFLILWRFSLAETATVAKRLQRTYAGFEVGTLWTRSTASACAPCSSWL